MRFISDTILRLYAWTKSEAGQTMAEYGLILALVSVVAIAALLLIGPQLSTVFTKVANCIQNTGC